MKYIFGQNVYVPLKSIKSKTKTTNVYFTILELSENLLVKMNFMAKYWEKLAQNSLSVKCTKIYIYYFSSTFLQSWIPRNDRQHYHIHWISVSKSRTLRMALMNGLREVLLRARLRQRHQQNNCSCKFTSYKC